MRAPVIQPGDRAAAQVCSGRNSELRSQSLGARHKLEAGNTKERIQTCFTDVAMAIEACISTKTRVRRAAGRRQGGLC